MYPLNVHCVNNIYPLFLLYSLSVTLYNTDTKQRFFLQVQAMIMIDRFRLNETWNHYKWNNTSWPRGLDPQAATNQTIHLRRRYILDQGLACTAIFICPMANSWI